MIIVKKINQKVVQVALAGTHQQPFGYILTPSFSIRNKKHFTFAARTFVQTAINNQKVTNPNNQQLISVARNISFRPCQAANLKRADTKTNAKASYSISAPSSQFITIDPSSFIDEKFEHGQQAESLVSKESKDVKTKAIKYYGQIFNEAVATTSERRLVVLLSWLQAQEKHIEKYRQFYLDRGFDVLNVKTSPLDLLLPNNGARKISHDFIRFMIEKKYSDVVLHGFSVGGYMFGRLLLEIDRHDEKTRAKLLNSIKGIVFDSLVPFEGTCVGVANSITQNPIGSKIIENILRFYLFACPNIATKYYLEASEKVWGGPLNCPTMFLMSKDDNISDYKTVERLESVWRNLGIDTRKVVVDSSPHVQIYSKHRNLYIERVENFLKHIKMYS